jgi:hypothetical protein
VKNSKSKTNKQKHNKEAISIFALKKKKQQKKKAKLAFQNCS